MKRVVLLFATLVALGACGDGGESNNDEADLSSLGVELTDAHCSKVFSCCSEAERFAAFQGIPVSTPEECTSSVEGIVQVTILPRYEEAIEKGTITYTGDVEGCVTGYRRLACEDFQPDPRLALVDISECATLFEPQLETTEFCSDDFECKSGFCAITNDVGTCAELPGEGEPCVAAQCQDGLFCLDGTCAERFEEGAACDVSSQCLSGNCVDVSDNGSGDLRCQPLPAACGG